MADAAGQDALLRTEGLSKSFGGVVATDNLNLTVRHGEAHAVIGPNGAGKTTLIAQLAGELAPSAGRIWFDGKDITGLPAHARVHIGIARSFQITNLLPSFTVAENLRVALRPRRGHSFVFLRDAARDPELEQGCRRCSNSWGSPGAPTPSRANSPMASSDSSSWPWRSRARPRLLLLDEPMAGIGHAEARGMIELLLRINQSCAMLLIEHDMDAVFRIADRITVLVGGRAIASGAPEAIRDDPTVRAAYLGDSEAW
jgi:branched-chain amino acid transport system ATP-binding protein